MKLNVMLKDRRLDPRLVYYGDVIYKNVKSDEAKDQDFKVGKAKNLSAFGMCLRSRKRLATGDVLEIKFDFKGIKMNLICEVVWDRFVTAGETFECGLSFRQIKEGDTVQLKKAIFENLYLETKDIIDS